MAWVYSQRRHTIRHVIDGNVEFSDHTGYSGNGNSRDDPRAEHKKNHGPIPRGHWTIGLIERSIMITTTEGKRKHLKDAMRLTYNNGPAPYGRDHFLIHGDNSASTTPHRMDALSWGLSLATESLLLVIVTLLSSFKDTDFTLREELVCQ